MNLKMCKMTKLLSLVVSLVMIVTTVFSFGITVSAATSGSCGSKATWSYNSSTKTLTISGTGATKKYNALISKVPWESYKSEIETVIVNEGITEIGEYSFYNCTALVSVSLPSTLTSLSGSGTMTASYGCFQNCTALQSITLPENLITIENCVFKDCTSLKSIVIPDSVTDLQYGCFCGCTSLETVTFGKGLTETGENAFYEAGVKKINWGDNIKTVSMWSFFKCNMTAVELPESVKEVKTRAFSDCTFLRKFTVNNANTTFSGDVCAGSEQEITVYGHKLSTAETFANENSYEFVSLDSCEHNSTSLVVKVAPTCIDKGISQEVCDDCGAVISENEVNALGHSYETIETVDNTDEDGHIYTTEKCTRCNDIKDTVTHQRLSDGDTNYIWIDGFYTYENTATCTKSGYERYTCTVDGCGKTESHIVTAGNHKVDEFAVTKQPTCTEDGVREGVCTECGETVTETIDATGHTYTDDDIFEVVDNTQEDGHIHTIYNCRVCGEQIVKSEHIEWVEGNYNSNVLSEAHCVFDGLRMDTCDVCSKTRLVTIPANGQHEWYVTSQTEPTCTSVGKIYYGCKNCSMTKSENISALGHDYVLVEQNGKEPTCVDNGSEYYKCSRCSATKQNTIPATGHTVDENNYIVLSDATCEEDGSAVSVCTVCSEQFEIVIPKLGHNFEDVCIDLTAQGKPGHSLVTPTCSRCKTTKPSEIRHDEWVDGYYTNEKLTSATCVLKGTNRDICTVCNTTRINYTPALGHNYNYTGELDCEGMHYRCSYCLSSTVVDSRWVYDMWNYSRANSRDINRTEIDDTCYLDANGDGIMNGKDFAIIRYAYMHQPSHTLERVVVEPTCDTIGCVKDVCTVCGYENVISQSPALGHNYGEDGICENCGKTKDEVDAQNNQNLIG